MSAFEMPIDSKTNSEALGMMEVGSGNTYNNGGFSTPEFPTFKKAGAVEFKAEAGNTMMYVLGGVLLLGGLYMWSKSKK